MIAQEILVKKHVVPLHADERSHLSPDSVEKRAPLSGRLVRPNLIGSSPPTHLIDSLHPNRTPPCALHLDTA